MNAHLVRIDGAVKISVNGKIIEPYGFMTYNADGGQFQKQRDIGTKLFFFGAYSGDKGLNSLCGLRALTPHFFVAKGTYDFTEIERILTLIAPDGTGAYIIPRVYLSTSEWWEEENPDALSRDDRGEAGRESFASDKWREDMWGALKALIDFVNGSKWKECVIGYHIAAGSTEEWTYHGHKYGTRDYFDYSDSCLNSFRLWLFRRYGSVEKLNVAWNKSYSSFEEIPIPSVPERRCAYNGVLHDLSREMNVVDFCEYSSDLFAESILFFCRKVKEYSNNTLLTGAFYGYVAMLSDIDKNHYAMGKVIDSPYIDFLSTTHGGGAPWPFGSAVDSCRLRGKLFISEGDIRTCLTRTLDKTLPHAVPDNRYYTRQSVWRGPEGMDRSVSELRRSASRTLTGNTGLWWFDMFGGWFDSPEMMSVIERVHTLAKGRSDQPIKPEIAYIIDENGLKYFRRNERALYYVSNHQRVELSLCGAPYHLYLAEDIARDDFPADDYRLYFFVHMCRSSEKVSEAIEKKLKKGGKTLLWTYFSGLDRPLLTDFDVYYDSDLPDARCEYSEREFPTFSSVYEFTRSSGTDAYPPEPLPCARFGSGEKENSYVLATLESTGEAALLWKNMGDYHSVYSLLPAIPNQILRELCLMSNVHVYNVTGDALMAGGKYIALRTLTEGEKRIHFPFPIKKVTEVFSGKEMKINDIFIDFDAKEHETFLFEIEV